MDFEALLSLLLVLFYIFLQFTGRKKREQQRRHAPLPTGGPAPQRTAEPNRGMSELERALHEIRTALGGPESQPPIRKPAPAPIPQQNQQRLPPRPTPTTKPAPVPNFEDTFESQHFEEWRPDAPLERRAPKKSPARPVAASQLAPTLTKTESRIRTSPKQDRLAIQDLLNAPGSARNAVLLGEILGPPRSRKPF